MNRRRSLVGLAALVAVSASIGTVAHLRSLQGERRPSINPEAAVAHF